MRVVPGRPADSLGGAGTGKESRMTPRILTWTLKEGNPVWGRRGEGEDGELLGAGWVEKSVEQLVVLTFKPLDIQS